MSSTEIDEVGYLAYGDRYADLLFEVMSRRYEDKSLLLTTNRPFSEWSQVFPNAACVVSLIDRIIHRAEILAIDGESFRAARRAEEGAASMSPRQGPTHSPDPAPTPTYSSCPSTEHLPRTGPSPSS